MNYECALCLRSFPTIDGLAAHEEAAHEGWTAAHAAAAELLAERLCKIIAPVLFPRLADLLTENNVAGAAWPELEGEETP